MEGKNSYIISSGTALKEPCVLELIKLVGTDRCIF